MGFATQVTEITLKLSEKKQSIKMEVTQYVTLSFSLSPKHPDTHTYTHADTHSLSLSFFLSHTMLLTSSPSSERGLRKNHKSAIIFLFTLPKF